MKIVALLGVKDEVELIGASINQLRSIGVDLIIAYDDGSTDGTLEVLEALKTKDDLWVVHVGRVEPWSQAITETFRLEWARKTNADWFLFLDADEFWIPATGSLRDCHSLETADILTVDRFNVPPTRRGPLVPEFSPSHYKDLFLCVETIPDFHLYIKQHPDAPWILGQPIAPKVLARPDVIATVSPGGHFVEPAGDKPVRRTNPPDILVAHVPFTTFESFERKVINIGEVIRVSPDFFNGYVAWHWKRWATMLETGHLREEFERQVLDEQLLASLLESGVIRTAAAILTSGECDTQPGRDWFPSAGAGH